jgi:hypothetical protein
MSDISLSSLKLVLKLTATLQNTLTSGAVVSIAQPDLQFTPSLTNGVGANQANRSWQYSGVLGITDAITLNLYSLEGIDIGAGVAKDALGQDIAFENIVALIITNDNAVTDTGQLEITPANSNGWKPMGNHTAALGGALKGQGALVMVQLAEGGFDVPSVGNNRIALHAVNGDVDYSVYILARNDDEESSSSSSSVSSSSLSSSQSNSSNSSSSVSSSSSSSSQTSSSSSSVNSSSSHSESESSPSSQSSVSSSSSSISSLSSSSSSRSYSESSLSSSSSSSSSQSSSSLSRST